MRHYFQFRATSRKLAACSGQDNPCQLKPMSADCGDGLRNQSVCARRDGVSSFPLFQPRSSFDPGHAVLHVPQLDSRGDSTSRPKGALSRVDDILETPASLDVEHCFLIGASLGAVVAIEVALTRPPPVGALILLARPDHWLLKPHRIFERSSQPGSQRLKSVASMPQPEPIPRPGSKERCQAQPMWTPNTREIEGNNLSDLGAGG